jgi:hypothetical protein
VVKYSQSGSGSPKITQQQEKQTTPVRDKINYRRHKGACPFYRENWSCESERNAPSGQLLYQIICLMDTPPVTADEQNLCLHSPTRCWRLSAAARQDGRNGHATPSADSDESEDSEAEEAPQAR